ncbi:MAG: hypothetical protein KF789_06790 [Bdellovibrionaceae bacterium]|nr:hypothetical protein [Pseudobdellovibrionaceae bacterium]
MDSVLNFSSRWLLTFLMGLALAFSPGLVHAQLKKDGTPDMRYKANRDKASQSSNSGSSSRRETPPPRRDTSPSPGPLKKDGTPDMRYKENRDRYGSNPPATTTKPPVRSNPEPGPLKKDGTPDMRYKENRDRYGSNPPAASKAPDRTTEVRPRTTTPRSQWATDGQGRYVEPRTGRPLNNDGTYDMRRSENRDLKTVSVDPKSSRPRTSTPKNQWKVDSNNRYYDPVTGRPLNNDGTFDMRRAENKDLPNPASRVRIGTDNGSRTSDIQSRVRSNPRNNVVINYYYTNVYNTYVTNNVVYGSWGWQTRYYSTIIWGQPLPSCYYGCVWYTTTYWDYWVDRYHYYPAYYFPYRPVILNDSDLSIGLISWLFVHGAMNRAYDNGYNDGYNDAVRDRYYDDRARDYYRDALPSLRPVEREFMYSQAYMPTEDFVELARDVSGADPRTVQNFMDGLEDLTTRLQAQIQQATFNPGFRIAQHDIDVRVAENYGNRLIVLKGHLDRRHQNGRDVIARADFTGTIDLLTGQTKLFVVTATSSESPMATPEQIMNLQEINRQIEAASAQVGY